MSVTFRRTSKGTTIRASGADAWRLLDALGAFAAEPQAQQSPAVASKPVPNRSNSRPSTTAAAAPASAATAPRSELP